MHRTNIINSNVQCLSNNLNRQFFAYYELCIELQDVYESTMC